MDHQLAGKKILILVANGVDQAVMSGMQRDLVRAGAAVKMVGIEPGLVSSWHNDGWGLYFPVDQQVSQTLGSDFDCLVVPSGSRGIQKLAANAHSERIISSFAASGKLMVFMGDAAELLDKTGHAEQRNNADIVVRGDCADIGAAVQAIVAHFTGPAPAKKAA